VRLGSGSAPLGDEGQGPQARLRIAMADWLYDEDGDASAFRIGDVIYNTSGAPVGRVANETGVFDLQGRYVGELEGDRVISKGFVRGSLGAMGLPGNVGAPAPPARRAVAASTYPDALPELLGGS